jgi:hypothetical protein
VLLVLLVGACSYCLALYWNHDLSADELGMLRKLTRRGRA